MYSFGPLASYVAEVWRRRRFWYSLAKLDLELRYRESILGCAWSMLHPLAMTAVLCVAFGTVFRQNLRTYALFVLSGVAVWSFISGACLEGCLSIRCGEKFMRVHPGPIAVYALRTLCSQLFHFLVLLGLTILLSCSVLGFRHLATVFVLLPVTLLLALFGVSLILIFGILDVYFPDSKHILQIGLQLLFYVVPIVYPREVVPNETFKTVLHYNPLTAFVTLVRVPIVDRSLPSLETWLMATAATSCALVFAMWLVRRCERTIIFQL
ncbi:hypothetical protein AYO40_02055 [Planctomycetaceae bacterium SCGC AG-212-D15]|nr:hypothetical protein AYO40_02055 [Planctomycetaceae bacterium SCGC AG-212-D15]